MHTTEQLNTALAGRYAVDHVVGEGGMATVYLARDLKHKRKVALKLLKPELAVIVGIERFLAEIQVTANLQHPNLLPLFDSGTADSLLFYVMPFVEGESLRTRLDREKQLPIDDAIRIATAVASALDYAHRQGVIHRDLKPANILLHDGNPLVADFGIALAVSNAGGSRITQTGLSLGTPMYMSPEQATGDRAIDARTDIYSLAAVTYEMLTGDPPHTGSTSQAVIARLLTDKPRSIRESRASVPLHVNATVEKALEKLPADRWPTAREFADALSGARPVPVTATESARAEGAPATGASRRVLAREAIAWALAASGIAAASYVATRPETILPTPVAARLIAELPDSFTPPTSPYRHVAISHDGRRLAVISAKGGRAMIYVRRLEDSVFAAVPGSEGAASVALSYDGESVAFHILHRGVFKLQLPDGTAQLVADSADLPRWGESGEIVFRTAGDALGLAPADGSKLRFLRPDSASQIDAPSLLPGGRDMLVSRASGGGGRELVLVSTANGHVTPLNMPGFGGSYSAGRVVFARSPGQVLAAPFSLDKRAFTGAATALLQGVGGNGLGSEFDVTGNGTLVYMTGHAADLRSMVTVDREGIEQPLSREDRLYGEPRVSPDGRRVVMRIGKPPDFPDAGIFEVGTGALTLLPTDKQSTRAEWSRDGTRIITIDASRDSTFVQSRPWDGNGSVETLHRGVGIAKEKSVVTVSIGPPQGWSAFGVTNAEHTGDILIAPTDSLQALRPFIGTPATGFTPRVSPSGRLLAYSSLKGGRMQVYLRPIPGPGPEVLVSIDAGREPIWSSDGKSLFYRGPKRMMVATVAEQPSLAVTKRDSLFIVSPYDPSDIFGAYDVFPDGKRFVMTRLAKGSDKPPKLFVVVNWAQLAGQSALK
jgi:serine/threonine-protein kinase